MKRLMMAVWAACLSGALLADTSYSFTYQAALRDEHGAVITKDEPFEPQNQPAIVELLRQVKSTCPNKSIWAFSGYLFQDILSGRLGPWEITKEYLSYLDVLVDGPFMENRKNLALRFRGSENQRLIDVPASLASGEVVLWKDWQSEGKGMRK